MKYEIFYKLDIFKLEDIFKLDIFKLEASD